MKAATVADVLNLSASALRTSVEDALILLDYLDGEMESAPGIGDAQPTQQFFHQHLSHAVEALDNVIFLTSPQTKNARFAQNTTSLDEVLQHAKTESAEMAARYGVTISSLPDCLGSVAGDWVHLKKAMGCLLEIAIKYIKPGAAVQIRGMVFQENVILTIGNEGGGSYKGRPATFSNRPADVTAETTRDALGLPFAVAQHIIRLLSGRLVVRKAKSRGIWLQVFLPRLSVPTPCPAILQGCPS